MTDTLRPIAENSPLPEIADPLRTVNTEVSMRGDSTAVPVPVDPLATRHVPPTDVPGTPETVLDPVVGTLMGQYRLEEMLGKGGMGTVWKAFHVKLKKHVALKLLPPELTREPLLVARFEREMESVARVDSPHVVRGMDAGEFQGLHYLVMEYIEGVDLSKFVKDRGPRPVREACELVRQAALGLAAAHKLGLVHRDIKPGNLFLTTPKDGAASVVKVLDLGLARLVEEAPAIAPGAEITGQDDILGTPDYMAPEQWFDARDVDARTDLYALGCTLYCLLVGRAPYGDEAHRSTTKKIFGHTLEPIPDLRAVRSDVPADLDAIYRKLMAKKPQDRFQTADELATLLQTIVMSLGSGAGRRGSANGESAADPSAALVDADSVSLRTTLVANAPPQGTDDGLATREPASAKDNDKDLKPVPKSRTPEFSHAASQTPSDATGQAARPHGSGLSPRVRMAGALVAAAARAGAIIITIKNKDGSKTTIEIPGTSVVTITPRDATDDSDSSRKPSNRRPSVRNPPVTPRKPQPGEWPADAPKPAVAPFDAAQARKHQEEWAAYLKIPVEHTNSIGMKFVLIPPGEFTMGSTPEEMAETLKQMDAGDTLWQSWVKSEAPQHRVILTQPIYLGVTEVRQADYEKVMGKNPSFFAKTGREKKFVERVDGLDTSAHPVENVSWNDAAEFCAKLSQQEKLKPFYHRAGETVTQLDGAGYRLPTEAEWEFSCRAGTTTRFWIGDTEHDLLKAGWFNAHSGLRTHAAGELKANPFGLFDIHGNVLEWVQDAWDPTFYGQFQEKPAVDPSAPFTALTQHVIRGGFWFNTSFRCRSSNRDVGEPVGARSDVLGFRVSLVASVSRVGD